MPSFHSQAKLKAGSCKIKISSRCKGVLYVATVYFRTVKVNCKIRFLPDNTLLACSQVPAKGNEVPDLDLGPIHKRQDIYIYITFAIYTSKISPTYPWKLPRTLHQQFLKEFLSLWVWGSLEYLLRVCELLVLTSLFGVILLFLQHVQKASCVPAGLVLATCGKTKH